MYAFFSDNSIYGKKVEDDIRRLGLELTLLTSPEQIGEIFDESYAGVIVVNPHLRRVRSVRENLGKLGGRVSLIPIIGIFQDIETLPEIDTLKALDDFVCGDDAANQIDMRTRVLLARNELDGNAIIFGELVINMDSHQVFLNSRPIDLTYKEFELLRLLAATPGRAYSREDLLRNLWGYDYFGGTRTVDVHIRRLRSKIESSSKYIETVHGLGYRFVSE